MSSNIIKEENMKNGYEPKVNFISMREFNEINKIGGLIWSSKYYDCSYYCDKEDLYKTFKEELQNKKILKVLTITENYEKIQNKKIKYNCPLFCEPKLTGSYLIPEYNSYLTNHPYGDVTILTREFEDLRTFLSSITRDRTELIVGKCNERNIYSVTDLIEQYDNLKDFLPKILIKKIFNKIEEEDEEESEEESEEDESEDESEEEEEVSAKCYECNCEGKCLVSLNEINEKGEFIGDWLCPDCSSI